MSPGRARRHESPRGPFLRISATASLRQLARRACALAFPAVLLTLSGCAALDPAPLSTQERLAAFPDEGLPLKGDVTVHWSAEQVPFVVAESDRDLAFTLGLVHMHLREAQLEILRRISQGRLSEMAGPALNEIDRGLRLIDYKGPADAILAGMPAESRAFLQAFVEGLNHYQQRVEQEPPEFGLLGIERAPWTAQDLLGIGRLAGSDVTWIAYFPLLERYGGPAWEEDWRRALESGGAGLSPAGRADAATQAKRRFLAEILSGFSRSGSNSLAISGERTRSGKPILANDPHLGFSMPNLWMLAGIKSPSFHAVGMMIPGLPAVALGRNPDLAWGGTNLRAASSDLYDVTDLPRERVSQEESRIETRFWVDETVTLRRTPLGPILSDLELFPAPEGREIALNWVGQEASDEFTALLNASRATDPESFRAAFASFAVSAQNMLFADREGNIGQVLAAKQPRRSYEAPPDLILDPEDPAQRWQGYDSVLDLPMRLNPESGYLASANNAPRFTERPLGYFFSPDDRVDRLGALVEAGGPWDMAALSALQRDVFSAPALALSKGLAPQLEGGGPLAAALGGWDGHYHAESSGASAFELLLSALVPRLYGEGEDLEVPSLKANWRYLTAYLLEDLAAVPAAERRGLLAEAEAEAEAAFAEAGTWAALHRIEVGHVLRNLPVLGGFFVIEDWAIGGSRETVFKTAHDLIDGRHTTSYGSQSRHISDLSDPDANWFVLFGGQDGWIGSENFDDMARLWRDGRYVQIPLRLEAVEEAFPTRMRLTPAGES